MAKNLPPRKETQKVVEIEENDENWVEEEGQVISDEEFETILQKAPLIDEKSRPLRDALADLGIDLDSDDD